MIKTGTYQAADTIWWEDGSLDGLFSTNVSHNFKCRARGHDTGQRLLSVCVSELRVRASAATPKNQHRLIVGELRASTAALLNVTAK